MEAFDVKKAAVCLVPAVLMALTLGVFAPVVFGGRTFAFRDGAHFYPPLWRLTAHEWSAGRLPLWNPYENLGQPLLASPPAAVFYPGQLLFLLPLPAAWLPKLYVIGHVLLAAFTAYLLARAFRAGSMAASVCAIAYAFSGNVLMQHANAPFLVGAAWLPLTLLCIERIARLAVAAPACPPAGRNAAAGRNPAAVRWSLGLGALMALMVLGGDPQMAYNVGLIAALYVAIALVARRRRRGGADRRAVSSCFRFQASRNGSDPCPLSLWERVRALARTPCRDLPRFSQALIPSPFPKRRGEFSESRLLWVAGRRAFCLFGLAGFAALVLAAVQVLPSAQFADRSNRVPPGWGDRLHARLEPRSHHEHVYHFSVAPWRLAEFLWPNVSGRQYPVHRRWLDGVPAEGRIWTPTLYMGVFPLVLALAALRFRRGPLRQRWLSWLVLLSAVAGFGFYGLGWLLAELGVDVGVGGPFGGLYWLMNVVLPGYVRFRYPAKLLVITTLALSVLAARGWDRTFAGRQPRSGRLLFGLGAISMAGLLGAIAVRPFWSDWTAAVPSNPLFGPLDAAGAWRDLAGAFAQTALLCSVFAWLLWKRTKAEKRDRADLCDASEGPFRKNGPVPFRSEATVRPRAGAGKGRGTGAVVAAVPLVALALVAADLGWANAWLVATAPDEVAASPSQFGRRIAQAQPADDEAGPRVWRHPVWLRPEWRESGSPDRLAEAKQFDLDTVWPNYNFDMRIAVAEVHGTMMLSDYAGFLAASRSPSPEGPLTVFDLAAYAVRPSGRTMPARWEEVDRVPGAVLWRNRRPLPRAWIAAPESAGRLRNLEGESCRIVHFDPQRIDMEATLLEPGLVVLAEQHYPGWRLEVSRAGEGGRSVPIRQANGVMRAAELPAGSYRMTFRFRPRMVYLGALISGFGWLALAGWIGWTSCRRLIGRWPPPNESPPGS